MMKRLNPELLYLTDDIKSLAPTINERKTKFFQGMEKEWKNSKAQFLITEEGERILKIFDLEVMAEFEKPYMKKLANIAVKNGGNILNIGYGLGIVDYYIEQARQLRGVKEHHIIELNKDVYNEAVKWKNSLSDNQNIIIHFGNWKDVLPNLSEKNFIFDGIIYDAYPLKVNEIHRDSIPFISSLINSKLIKAQSGILTFFMDSVNGFGNSFLHYIKEKGIEKASFEKVSVFLPNRKIEFWNTPYFLAPVLTGIRYQV